MLLLLLLVPGLAAAAFSSAVAAGVSVHTPAAACAGAEAVLS